MNKFKLFFITLLILFTGVNAFSQEIIIKSAMDLSVNPGDDFFRYVNGTWLNNTEIPAHMSRFGSFDELRENNSKQLYDLLTELSDSGSFEKGSNKQKIGDFFISGMDEERINSLGYTPLKIDLDIIQKITDKNELISLIAHFHKQKMFLLFRIGPEPDAKDVSYVIAGINQAGLGLADKDYYLKDNERMNSIRAEYKKYIINVFKLIGYNEETAVKKMESVFEFEKSLSEKSFNKLERTDPQKNYNKMSLSALKEICPELNWDSYFNGIDLKTPGDINVSQKPYFESLGKIITDTDLEVIKSYMELALVRNNASVLSSDFVNNNFEFYTKFLTGVTEMKPRWKRVLDFINIYLGEALGELYVGKYFPPEYKQRITELVSNLQGTMKERILNLEWMSEATKNEAVKKLEKMIVKVGYPDKWKDYSELEISRDSYYNNLTNARILDFVNDLKEIGKPYDKMKWGLSPQIVNAFYNPPSNEICFPAGILQPPFFFGNGDDAVNYGAIGVVIGHEMSHGFDNTGRQYDGDGNLKDWWKEEDAENFKKRTQVLVDRFNNIFLLGDNHVDGELTLGENIADLGGVMISYSALKKAWDKNPPSGTIEGFTPQQRFFLSYGQIWRSKMREKELLRRLKDDEHSPSEARVNGIVYNVQEFYDAFGIGESASKFIPKDKRVSIW
jgi:putative endopeptidase